MFSKKKICLLALLSCSSFLGFSQNRTAEVSTSSELLAAVIQSNADKLDTIKIKKGIYDDLILNFYDGGASKDNPLVIQGEDEVFMTANTELNIHSNTHFVKIKNLSFGKKRRDSKNSIITLYGGNNIVSECEFDYDDTFSPKSSATVQEADPSYKVTHLSIFVAGKNNSILNNAFRNKRSQLSYINIGYDWAGTAHTDIKTVIKGNTFSRPKGKGNGFSAMRIGHGKLKDVSMKVIVEDNLFESCNGESEIISVKSSDNILRNNTFKNSYGSLTLRQGSGNLVSGNRFLGDQSTPYQGGVTAWGKGHVIINNYFENLRPRDAEKYLTNPKRAGGRKDLGAISINSGSDFVANNTTYPKFEEATDVIVANNTIINTQGFALSIGARNQYVVSAGKKMDIKPRNIKIHNNLVINNKADQSKDVLLHLYAENVEWSDNAFIANNTGTADLDEINQGNSNNLRAISETEYSHEKKNDLFIPSEESESIIDKGNAEIIKLIQSNYSIKHADILGQERGNKVDIGAFEIADLPEVIDYEPNRITHNTYINISSVQIDGMELMEAGSEPNTIEFNTNQSFSVQANRDASNSYSGFWEIWIDLNRDGIFGTDEKVVSSLSQQTSSVSGSIQPDKFQENTHFRMRVKTFYYFSKQNKPNTTYVGDAKDYDLVFKKGNSQSQERHDSHLSSSLKSTDRTFSIYPNPVTNGQLNVDVKPELLNGSTLQIMNLSTGGVELIHNVVSEKMQLDLSSFENGDYLILGGNGGSNGFARFKILK